MAFPDLNQIDSQYLQQDEERNKVQVGMGSDSIPRYIRTTEDGYLIAKLMGYDVDGTETDIQITVDPQGRLNIGGIEVTGDITVDTAGLETLISDNLDDYKLDAWLEVGAVIYVGFLRKDGAWFIKKIDTTNSQVRYIKGASGYSFADPASLSYDPFDTEF